MPSGLTLDSAPASENSATQFGTAVPFGLTWALIAGLAPLTVVVFQSLGATLMPDNRGGALSSVLSFRFLGHAVGPLVWVPVFDRNVEWAFIGAGALGLVTLAALIPASRPDRADTPAPAMS